MNVDEIKKLVEVFQESGIDELEVNWGEGQTIRMTKHPASAEGNGVPAAMPSVVQPVQIPPAATPAPGSVSDAGGGKDAGPSPDEGLVEIRSPMVGTFYRAPSPESPSFVEAGSRVEKGQVVCIVEAMKLMNEIESEVSGTVVRAALDNGEPVEFSQPLFYVRPD